MHKVYILSDTGHDYSDAKRFGIITFVSAEKFPIFNPGEVLQIVKKSLIEFDSENDYLIISNAAFVVALALTYLFMSGRDKVNVLIFDAKRREYVPRTITNGQLF